MTQIAADEKYAYHDLYAVWQRYFPVTVIKHVVGADTSTQFEFTPNFDFNKDSSSDYHKKFELTGETGSNTKEFVNVPEGSKFTITEKAYDDFNTSVKYSVDADGTEKDITDQTIENGGEITVTGDVTVEFTNSLKAHPITILKVDENNTEQTLPGAKFLLSMKNDNDEYVAYVTEGHPDGSYTTNDQGKIGLELPAGKFQLIEQNAPDGYIITNSTVLFTVNQDGTITVTSGSNASASGATLTITNKSGTPLPNSGGPGTHWIYLLGAILMLGSGITLVSRRRIGKTE